MKIKPLVLALVSLCSSQSYAQSIAQLNFEQSLENITVNYGDVTSIARTNINPISDQYSLQINALSHFEIERSFELNQAFTKSTPFEVSFDVKLPALADAQFAQDILFYTSFTIEFNDGSQMQIYGSDAHVVPPQAQSIHSFDTKTTLPKNKKIKHVSVQWSMHLLEEMPVIFDNISATIGENHGETSTMIAHFPIQGNFESATQAQLNTYFRDNPTLIHFPTESGQSGVQINADDNGRFKLKFEKNNLFIVHSTPEYLATYVTLHNPGNKSLAVNFSGRADYTKELSGTANTIANYNTLVLAANETKRVPLVLDFSDDYYTSAISSVYFEIESNDLLVIDDLDMYSASNKIDGAIYQVLNDYEAGRIDFTTRYPDDVSIAIDQNSPLYGDKSLTLSLSPWRQASYSHFFPWGEEVFANQIHTQLDLKATQADYGKPIQVCTDVYYHGGERASFCEERVLGKGSFQINEIYTLDQSKALYRLLIRVRSFSSSTATVSIDNFSLKYWRHSQ
ncbi:hypothetical protein [Pseudoalteromonas luteoviolacea]|uniref:Uncharacterized protein n=1 Tax=Pseudoalteromonas luteoviolacea S4054 TaxID=1129367 RepID=A0A0F6A8C3_9GAMM|nr:hypothetical protein [Pseudoalteromonas luteoviolacea]AOT09317.1 hypothetical protein S4054249_16330 [Pseudoalteromonas luteoviolacea]AOT14229.1 hypothetical protein S40542_16300 [Pseudoalteromonas luteoviolacea]AOT19145.1 hypothetical protein S4054_16305 [Pseudoalteromonas luteoviolacea]KKE82111.1 hypothetical protein N479_19950 [Pseudoalteromonas luteoviolacea S4054]KZN73421.1 hypothetical protein N481_11895 [Pseudoalteromonas luteoviolacea S4047-1]